MKHLLLLRQQLSSKILLPCRCSFLHFPKTIPSPPNLIHDSLKRRIDQSPHSAVSVTPLLRHWCDCGNQPRLPELRSIVSSLHRSNRFSHALQVSEWMSDQQQAYTLSPVDFETRLLLIAKVRGLDEASTFLDTIPLSKRDFHVHYALLNCCKTHGSLTLAESTFQKMTHLGLASNDPKPYNAMLCLYHQAEKHDMVVKLLREMDAKNMAPEGVPFSKLLSSFGIASVLDVQGMERFLNKWKKMMEAWATCFFPGLVYMRAGSKAKGLALLRETEQLLDDSSRETIFGCLMTAYRCEGQTKDVFRLWNLAKDHGISLGDTKCPDIIKGFIMKGDLDDVLEEWDEHPNLDLRGFGLERRYAKEEAEKVVNILGKEESKWDTLADKLNKLVEDEDDKEEERMKRVAEAMEGRLHDRWNPSRSMALCAYTCVQYVEGRRDMESAADILRLLNKQEQVLRAMDKDRLSMKLVEAMRGGGED